MEEIFTIMLLGDGNELLEISKLNNLDKSILDLRHSVSNFGSAFECLGYGLTIQPCCSICCIG